MSRKILAILIGSILLVSLSNGAFSKGKPRWNANTNTIYADGIVIQFHERTPTYRIWIPGKNDTAVYIVKFNRIVEFIDKDSDGRFNGSVDQLLAQAPLTAHDIWEVSAEEISRPDGVLELRISFNGTVEVQPMGPGPRVGYAEVAFINHLYNADVNVSGYEIQGNRELKIDIVISDWPWSSDDSKLALEIVFAGMFKGHARTPQCHREKMQYQNREAHKIRMQGEDGYYAEFKYLDHARVVNQNKTCECKINATDKFKRNSAVTWLTYPHFNGTLIHDPSITVGEEGRISLSNTVIIAIVIIAVIVIVVAIIKLKK